MFDARITKIICSDPNYAFFTLVNYFGEKNSKSVKNVIKSDIKCRSIVVSEYGVRIGKNAIIEPNVTIMPGVIIGDNVIIRSGATLGVDSFQHQRTSQGMLSPRHDGQLHISNGVEIGSNSSLSKGFSYRSTKIGENTKIDAQSYIAHGVQIGSENIICAGARIMGHSVIGNEVFIGPGAIISSRVRVGDKARVSIGSVVNKNVEPGQQVSGNFAVDHHKFIAWLKKIR